MIYVKSHYNRLDKKYFGKKVRYDYKKRITSILTKHFKKCKIQISQEQKSYLKNNLISLFTIYRYFRIKTSELYRLLILLSKDYIDSPEELTQQLLDTILNNKGYTQGKNIE